MIKLTDPEESYLQDAKAFVCDTCGNFETYLIENFNSNEHLLEIAKMEGHRRFQNDHMSCNVCKECAEQLGEDDSL